MGETLIGFDSSPLQPLLHSVQPRRGLLVLRESLSLLPGDANFRLAGGLRCWTRGSCTRMLSCSLPIYLSVTTKDKLLFFEAEGKKPIKSKAKAGVKAAGAVSALGSCRRVVLSSNFAPLPWQLSKGTYPSLAPRHLTLTEIQLQPLIEVDKPASSHFRNC